MPSVWAALVGHVIFGHGPGIWTWLGAAAVIIVSALFIALVEASNTPGPILLKTDTHVPTTCALARASRDHEGRASSIA